MQIKKRQRNEFVDNISRNSFEVKETFKRSFLLLRNENMFSRMEFGKRVIGFKVSTLIGLIGIYIKVSYTENAIQRLATLDKN